MRDPKNEQVRNVFHNRHDQSKPNSGLEINIKVYVEIFRDLMRHKPNLAVGEMRTKDGGRETVIPGKALKPHHSNTTIGQPTTKREHSARRILTSNEYGKSKEKNFHFWKKRPK